MPAYIHSAISETDIDSLQYNIAGINFRQGVSNYVGSINGYIQPQPSNRYDPNAIAVYSEDGHHLGYIPATETYEVHSLHLSFPAPVAIDIEECYDDSNSRNFYVGTVTLKINTKI